MQDLPNGGGRRSKHWPPGAGDPRFATAPPPLLVEVEVSQENSGEVSQDKFLPVEVSEENSGEVSQDKSLPVEVSEENSGTI